jgi:pilus assembly protein CpaB
MKSRLIAGVAAVIMAILGALLVFTYAGHADDRAVAELQPVDVLVVNRPVPAGTPAEQLGDYLVIESMPSKAVPQTALDNLESSAGKVTSTDLVPGEQLLDERLVAPEDIEATGAIEVPEGLQEISFQLEPQRVAGGRIVPGDRVGVFISMEAGGLGNDPNKETTQLVLHKTLVTAIQRAPQATTEEGTEDSQALPQGTMLVTVAVDDRAAQRIVFAAEFARIWLSKEPKEAKESKPNVLQRIEVYR